VLLLSDSRNEEKAWRRNRDRRLVEIARLQHASGIALDFDYSGVVPDADEFLCETVDQARKEGVFVIAAPDLTGESGGVLKPQARLGGSLPCFPAQQQGHAMGLADLDRTVRTVPLYWEGDRNAPAFSLRVATAIREKLAEPPLELESFTSLRFLPPRTGTLQIVAVDDLSKLEQRTDALSNYFIIVGEQSRHDVFRTPFSDKPEPGAVVHAYATHSLVSGTFVRRPGPLWSVIMILVSCYALTLFAARGFTVKELALVAGLVTIVIVVASVAAMYFWNVWLDVIYAITALWLLVPVLLASRRLMAAPKVVQEAPVELI
jgi:CHASE2 domain-containing sensor protein